MLKKVTILFSVVTFGALLGLAYRMSQPAQAASDEAWAEQSTVSETAAQGQKAEIFTGTIAKQGDAYVLKSGSTTYNLDDQAKAASFEGKRVKVQGTLDPATNTIRVQQIEALT